MVTTVELGDFYNLRIFKGSKISFPISTKKIYLNPIALRMAKTLLSFDHSECNRVNYCPTVS